MKKLMTSTIILLPLLILAIMLVSGAIMSLVTHIYVESVEFVQNETLVLVMSDEEMPPEKQLEVNILPLKAENRGVRYSIEDESIASVDENGVITANYFGETYVTVVSEENAAATAKRKVLVTDTAVHKIEMNGGYKTELYERETLELSVTVVPKEAENKSVTWVSSDESVLRVSANGTVTAVGSGKAFVTAISDDNNEATAKTTEFTCYRQLRSLEVDRTLVITSDKEATFPTIKPVPEDAEVDIAYTSSDPSLATVDSTGHIVFKKEGHVVITATATDFGGTQVPAYKEYTCTDGYFVLPIFDKTLKYEFDYDEYFDSTKNEATKPLEIPFATSLEGSYRQVNHVEYYYTYDPDESKQVKAENVLTFDDATKQFRFIGPMAAGRRTVTIRVEAEVYDSQTQALAAHEYDNLTVTVYRNAESVDVTYHDVKAATITLRDTKTLTFTTNGIPADGKDTYAQVTVLPANHTNSFKYTVSDGTVATFSTGRLTFNKEGTVKVTVEMVGADGKTKASTQVTVVYAPIPKVDPTKPTTNPEAQPQKPVQLPEVSEMQAEGKTEAQIPSVSLAMSSEPESSTPGGTAPGETEKKQEAVVFFTEPAGTTVTYEAEPISFEDSEEGEVVPQAEEVVRVEKKDDGALHIIPLRGGFARVTITVAPESVPGPTLFAARAADDTFTYTMDIYVDRAVSTEDFLLNLGGTKAGKTFCMTGDEINFDFKVADKDGSMQGKKVTLKYGGTTATGEDNKTSKTGTITFPKDKNSFNITLGVEYTEDALRLLGGDLAGETLQKALDALKQALGKVSEDVTVYRNADGINVAYDGVDDVQKIVTSNNTITFSTDIKQCWPVNCFGSLVYKIGEGDKETASFGGQNGNVLTFEKAGEVTVTVYFRDMLTIEHTLKTFKVAYAPATAQGVKAVTVKNGNTAEQNLILSVGTMSERGAIYFTEQQGATVTYTSDKDEIVTVKEEGGLHYITPVKGGFATVTVSAKQGAETKEYKIHVYVDRAISASQFSVQLNDAAVTGDIFCATGMSIPFTFEFKGDLDIMAGKKLVVKYGTTTENGTGDAAKFDDKSIAFGTNLSELYVTFGVEYTDAATARGASASKLTSTTKSVRIYRNAESATVTYGGVENVQKIVISNDTLTFGATSSNTAAKVTVLPAVHYNATVLYAVGEEGVAKFGEGDQSYVLTFEEAGEVTVTLSFQDLLGATHVLKTLTVVYAPQGANSKSVTKDTTDLVLNKDNGQEGIIYFTEPAGKTVTYDVTDGAGVVEVKNENGAQHIKAQKGGFATVTITVDETTSYTVNIYVDRAISENDFQITLGENTEIDPQNPIFCATGTSVPYTFEFTGAEDIMAGKRLVVKYSTTTENGTDDAATHNGNIAFGAELSNLAVTFRVEYTDKAEGFGLQDASLSRIYRTVTLYRNPDSITFSYRGTTTEKISTWRDKLTLTTSAEQSPEAINVNVQPAAALQVCTVKYSIIKGDAADLTDDVLTFTKTGGITVQVELTAKDGTIPVTKTFEIAYAPRTEENKIVEVDDQNTTVDLLLFMESDTKYDTGTINFTEPSGFEVKYTSKNEDIVEVKDLNGSHQIVPKKGGIATVEITVGARGDNPDKTYTINVYVDRPVSKDDFTINVNEADSKGTTLTEVPFTFTVKNSENGCMEGKQLVVRYGGKDQFTGTANANELTGQKIKFEGGELEVTFAVQYTSDVQKFSPADGLASDTRTLLRNASEVHVSHDGVNAKTIVTDSNTFTFGTDAQVNVIPETHTDTLAYALAETSSIASITADGKLTFTGAGAVTVKVMLKRGDDTTLDNRTVTVVYAPQGNSIKVTKDTGKFVLNMNEEGVIYFTEPEEGTVTYTAANLKGDTISTTAVKLEQGTDGAWRVKTQRGGFATIEITAGSTKHTVNVYVDAPVVESDITVKLGDQNDQQVFAKGSDFGTTLTTVHFTVTVANENGCMNGKQIVVTYGSTTLTGTAGAATYTGTINFPDWEEGSGTLTVTFKVVYASDAEAVDGTLTSAKEVTSTARTLQRNASSITVDYGGAENTTALVTTSETLYFSEFAGNTEAQVNIAPAAHTDTIVAYSVAGTGAEFVDDSTLKFTSETACTVTVTIKTMRGTTVTLTQEITVTYLPKATKDIDLAAAEYNDHIVLTPNQTANIYKTFDVATMSKVTASADGQTVVELTTTSAGAYTIKALKGGFATVTISVDGTTTYTVNVYVDETVKDSDIIIEFKAGEKVLTADEKNSTHFGTTATGATKVHVTVSLAEGKDSLMQGKKFVITYGSDQTITGNVNATTLEGDIDFTDLSTLKLTISVIYDTDATNGYTLPDESESKLPSLERTLERNASDVTVTYQGVETTSIVIGGTTRTLQFGTEGTAALITITSVGKNTDTTITYSVEGSGAHIDEKSGALTFDEINTTCTVTVVITLNRNYGVDGSGAAILSKTNSWRVTVTHVGAAEKYVDLGSVGHDDHIVLSPNGTAYVYLTAETGTMSEDNASIQAVEDSDGTIVELAQVQNGNANLTAWCITAVKGGFATVTISAGENKSYTVNVYVDAPVSADDFEIVFKANNKVLAHSVDGESVFRTFYDTVTFTVTITNHADSVMEGKKLYVKLDELGNIAILEGEAGIFELSGTLTAEQLAGENAHTIIFGIEYDRNTLDLFGQSSDTASTFVVYSIQSTHGMLYSKASIPSWSVYYSLTESSDKAIPFEGYDIEKREMRLEFSNVGERIALFPTSYGNPTADPADFTITYKFSLTGAEGYKVSLSANDVIGICQLASYPKATVIFEAKSTCPTEQQIPLSFFGQEYTLVVTVRTLAETIEVKGGGTENNLKKLNDGETYNTILDSLYFAVTIGRNDSINISNKAIQWSYDNKTWNDISKTDNDLTGYTWINIKDSPSNSIFFRSKDGGVSTQIRLDYVNISDVDFNFNVFVLDSQSKRNTFATIESYMIGTDKEVTYVLPVDMMGTITFEIDLAGGVESYLGGLGDETAFNSNTEATWTPVGGQGTWTSSKAFDLKQISFTSSGVGGDFTMKCYVAYYKRGITVTFSHVNRNIEFPGFDSGNPTDNYKGYQQVRVFAKHSDYAEDGTSKIVDYFKLPFKTTTVDGKMVNGSDSVDIITWTLTRYKEKAVDATTPFTLSQTGTQVIFNDKKYVVVKNEAGSGHSTLYAATDEWAPTGDPIAANGKYTSTELVPWVDVYAETGYAYLYFGDFQGLSEIDVLNDYFGDFGEQGDKWKKVADLGNLDDGSGRSFKASDNAYSFLRVAASIGQETADSCHFNFNVLDDNNLVNIFNAAGFYANANIVLHENLYGPGENPSAPETQVLNTTFSSKTTIYGNGNQVNFEARNAELVSGKSQGTSGGVDLQKAINVTVKASNPTEKIVKLEHVVVLTMQYGYYCDIEYYSKMSPWGADPSTPGFVYLKNTVLRCAAQNALQLYYSTSTAYLENVVLNECVGGFTADSHDGTYNVVFNFKGMVDVLNYLSFTGLASSINQDVSSLKAFGFDNDIKANEKYLEWFGKTPDPIDSDTAWNSSRFVNVFLYNRYIPAQQSTITLKFWDDTEKKYKTKEEGGQFDNKVRLATPIDKEVIMDNSSAGYKIFVYDVAVNSDGGQIINDSQYYNDRNMSQLFSENRYLRLLCQYLTLGKDGVTPEKNFDHILWHMQQCYRNPELIDGRTTDHMQALKESLENAKKRGWDGTWPDGTTLASALEAQLNAAALTAMISETVLPTKRDFN